MLTRTADRSHSNDYTQSSVSMGGSVYCRLWVHRFYEHVPSNPVCLNHYNILFFQFQIVSIPIREFKKL